MSAVVRIRGRDGTIGGAGFLVAPTLVLTCAHVVSDVLDLPRDTPVGIGAEVTVDLPLADGTGEIPTATADVRQWVPIRADQSGDVALLRLRDPLPGALPLPMADAESVWDHQARAVGFTDDHPDGIWHQGRFRGPTGRGWVQLSRTNGQAVHVKPGFSGSPVWDDHLGAAVGLMVAAQPAREAQQAFVLRTRALLREIPELAPVLRPAAPFRGLATFRETDAEVFFGRTEDVDGVVDALRGGQPSVTVYGPSGCGKSSLALAGVVPAMRRADHAVLVVDAGRVGSARAALATELFETARSGGPGPAARVDTADRVDDWLRELGLVDAFHRATGRSPAGLLVVLDQAEALLNVPEPELAEILALLFPIHPPAGLRVLVTLRADFMDSALSHPLLGPALKRGATLPLTPMTRDQLHTVITEPLARVPAVEYDPGLVRRILDDAGSEPGILPLLGFVLEQLWERRNAGRMRAATYEDIGGVSGALRRHADQAWRECVTPAGEAEAWRLLTGLVRVLPGGEAPLRRALTREEAGENAWHLARALAGHRLLVLYGGDGQPESAELAHEALIRVWPTLAELARADADFIAARAEVQHDLERWRLADRPADLLPGPLQLAALEARLRGRGTELARDQSDFLDRARRRRRARRIRAHVAWITVALVLALIAGLGTFLAQQSQVSARRQVEGRSRTLAVQSDEFTKSNPGQAALAALAAYKTAPTQEARNALLRRYEELRDAAWILSGGEGKILSTAMSTDGAVTLVVTKERHATLFVRSVEGRVRQQPLRLAYPVLSPVVSRDGRRIAYVRDRDGVVIWHDVTPFGKQLVGSAHPLQGSLQEPSVGIRISGGMKILDFSPDAQRLAGVSAMSTTLPAQVWDLDTGRQRTLPTDVAHFGEMWFGPDRNTLLAIHETGQGRTAMVTIDIGTATMHELADDINSAHVAVSGDGSLTVVCKQSTDLSQAHYEAIGVVDGRVLRRHETDRLCGNFVVDAKGEHFALATDSPDKWDLVETRGDSRPQPFLSSSGPTSTEAYLTLLGTPREPVLVIQHANSVTGWKLANADDSTTYTPPTLLGDGSTMVMRVGRDGASLRVSETEREQRTLVEVANEARIPPDKRQELAVNRAQTLVADVSDRNRITVRALPTLRRVAEFTTAEPPTDQDGKPELLDFLFLDGDRLLTVSGTHVEYWDARDGHPLSSPIDLENLRLTTEDRPNYVVTRRPEPGYVVVVVQGEPDMHTIDLRTGKENEGLRVHLVDGLTEAFPLSDRRHVAVFTRSDMVELWSTRPGKPAKREAGPFGPLNPDLDLVGDIGSSGFFLATGSSVRFLKADDPGYLQRYEFAENQRFLAATKDGKAVLLSPVPGGVLRLVRFDPALWRRHLCTVLGRGLTDDERGSLPGDLPTEICPP
ncbi:trypsin-like peptidase domain-containing protein (plasmid) [Embleya sp. NBC_00888]|uniref:nSTAND1 domain-containing NTPase n=1 Tax=Embleya sp. NBC_00888 TaxID=2975960 RepID=UPI002F91A23F|nr:trypsin-like peptidase domain-containing protein [Embleya sp. NBC_00888]